MDPPAVRPLMELEICEKNERMARNEKKPMLPNFKVLGYWLTCQVSSMTLGKNGENWDLLELR